MLSPVWYILFLLSMIRCCVSNSDLGIQVGEPFPSFDAEPNNLVDASEPPDQTDTREFSEVGLIQSIDQCRYSFNQKPRKLRSRRGEACPSLRQPFRDNGRGGTEAPIQLPQIVPAAGENPASLNSVKQPNPDDNLCPPAAPYPVCADPAAFPIAPDALFLHDLSRMQLKYCRACTYTINPRLPLHRKETGLGEMLADVTPAAAPSCQHPGEKFWCCDFVFTVCAQ